MAKIIQNIKLSLSPDSFNQLLVIDFGQGHVQVNEISDVAFKQLIKSVRDVEPRPIPDHSTAPMPDSLDMYQAERRINVLEHAVDGLWQAIKDLQNPTDAG